MLTFIKTDGGVPVALFADLSFIEKGALRQAIDAAMLPITKKHVVMLPDGHQGYGIPIGCVWATDVSYVSPYACGSDVGCGVTVVRTGLHFDDISNLLFREQLRDEIRARIPVGHNWRKDTHPRYDFLSIAREAGVDWSELSCAAEQKDVIGRQLGTLGSGNHFIELQVDEDSNVWVMVHSGSRNLGKRVCDYYHNLAKSQITPRDKTPKRMATLTGEHKDAYLAEMRFCKTFARYNRLAIINEVIEVLSKHFPLSTIAAQHKLIDVPHNYAAVEEHYGEKLMIHRKGATRAFKDAQCIIPGSQGTASYIVKGLGNELSFKSCSHGAGRKMSRKDAKKLDLDAEREILDKAGVAHNLSKHNLDESPSAYKDVNKVIQYQKELIRVENKLRPILVVKG